MKHKLVCLWLQDVSDAVQANKSSMSVMRGMGDVMQAEIDQSVNGQVVQVECYVQEGVP